VARFLGDLAVGFAADVVGTEDAGVDAHVGENNLFFCPRLRPMHDYADTFSDLRIAASTHRIAL
jgi:hypothetical protein